ncbi:MAG: ATP-binding protein, partial [Chlamydiota bacterium]|nr:ATP-binding protein [Chlamydiota bacterium]
IAKKDMNKLFKRFTQINRPVGGSGYKGTGLGLAISKEIVQLHNGKIWVESSAGKGTQFHVMIPAYQTEGNLQYYLSRMLDAAQESKTSLALFVLQVNNTSDSDDGSTPVDFMRDLEHHIGSHALRASDQVHYHTNRDRLVILAKANKTGANAMLNRIKKTLAHYSHKEADHLINSSLRIGMAMFPDDEIDPEKLLDAAMHRYTLISDTHQ